jgi:hypothetical protein
MVVDEMIPMRSGISQSAERKTNGLALDLWSRDLHSPIVAGDCRGAV